MVPENDDNWQNFLVLLKIMELTFAPVTTADKTVYLEILIENFLHDFTHLYPERPLPLKMHYLIHVPSWTRRYAYDKINVCLLTTNIFLRFGPLLRSWCMRYESKHRYFKGIAI